MYISTYFRGRLTFHDLMEMDIEFIPIFNKMIYDERKINADAKRNEIIEDAMHGEI